MSMLQQILDQMFVDPEILDALDEEQKQILFIKMREEQVKRWKAFEEKCENEGDPKIRVSRDSSRRIKWLKGEDGEVWVWVMGEHKDDLTIEEINEKRTLEEARHLAEKEMLESMRLSELDVDSVPIVGPNENESTLKEQLSRMEPLRSVDPCKDIQESMYEDANAGFELSSVEATQWLFPTNAIAHRKLKGILKNRGESSANKNSMFEIESQTTEYSQPNKQVETSAAFTETLSYNGSTVEHLPVADSSVGEAFSGLKSYVDHGVFADNVAAGGDRVFPSKTYAARIQEQAEFTPEISRSIAYTFAVELHRISLFRKEALSTRLRSEFLGDRKMKMYLIQEFLGNNSQKGLSNITSNGSIPLGVSYHSDSSEIHPNTNSQPVTSPLYSGINFRLAPSLIPATDIDGEISRRQSEIFEKMKEKQQQIDKEAEIEAERERQAWEIQEKRAREAEAQIRKIAQKAREQHRQQSLRTSTSILPVLKDLNASSLKEVLKSLPRPAKPKSRAAIISWFKVEELQRGTGLDPKTHRPAVWFHGIISRSRADELLQNRPSGSFLVRVSERIWGYTISYVVGDGKVKHFLIERIPQGYQFLGTNQIVHKHLHDLVAYHEVSPVTLKGNEILRWAVGQADALLPDYFDLIPL